MGTRRRKKPKSADPHFELGEDERRAMQAKLSDSLKRVLTSSDSEGGSDGEDVKRTRVPKEPAPKPEPVPFAEIAMADIDLEERIGVGNASTIFKGIWKGKEVAVKQYITYKIKQIQEGVMRSFNYEKRMMNSEETPALIMDHIPKSVYQLLQNAYIKEIEWPLRIKIARQVSEGLHHLHSLPTPLTHNDLKTDNLLLTETGDIRIIDFGHASLVSEAKHAEVTVFGNPSWTAPECLQGQPFSPKADVYAFGIILWELVTREEPLPGMAEDEMTKFVTGGGRPTIPADCPSAYAQLIKRCWANKPEDRPDAGEVADILAHWNSFVPPVAVPEVHVAHSLPSDFVPK